MKPIISFIYILLTLVSCSNGSNSIEKKGFQVNEISENEEGEKIVGLKIDSLQLETRPRNVLLTKDPSHRLIPIYKVNYTKKPKQSYIGSNAFHGNWRYDEEDGNNWNANFMPGFKAMYGYNLVNVSHFNNNTTVEKKFFKSPVLIKTLYYPSNSKDTLNYKPVHRKFYMASVYDEDTNNDGYINVKDLRRLYAFDIDVNTKTLLIPKSHSVMNSEYDSENDYMYIFTRRDKNNNGQMESNEPIDIFWIDLKNPENKGLLYKTE